MASRNLRRSISLATKSAQLAVAAPQVVAHRLSRMALHGANYSDQDLKEFARMGSEKQAAFLASWNAMALQVLRYQQSFMISWLQAVCMPWLGAGMTPASVVSRMQSAAIGTALSGLAPIHRTARANAKRLLITRIRLR